MSLDRPAFAALAGSAGLAVVPELQVSEVARFFSNILLHAGMWQLRRLFVRAESKRQQSDRLQSVSFLPSPAGYRRASASGDAASVT